MIRLAEQRNARALRASDPLTSTGLIVDGHVHYHKCFNWSAFLDAALANLLRGQRESRIDGHALPCLMLTESGSERAFRMLRDEETAVHAHDWSIQRTEEPCSLILRRHNSPAILVIAGRQIVTHEQLEVLALGIDVEFSDGKPIDEILDRVDAVGAAAVIPWGFGKWWRLRGRIVRNLIHNREGNPRIFLGDNSGRPSIGRTPSLFRDAASQGVYLLPGSDPLPFPNQVLAVGRYGFFLPGTFSAHRPASEIRDALRVLDCQPRILGRRETFWRFCRAQFAMQLKKRTHWDRS